ncbi:hypothetical protein THARTR1_03991 [Trichoderma harzianum]|uniref:Uncharacterized protein n=1 Tax=Trichoderma harzianum TaxID=5544 RepID=A0A2K0UDB6_TRIHA|nr:hypothetical protein THARTR1_03991 [Trichoderma harzianum]
MQVQTKSRVHKSRGQSVHDDEKKKIRIGSLGQTRSNLKAKHTTKAQPETESVSAT